jgi:hypothetical protein
VRKVGMLLGTLGGFFIVVALFAQFYAPGQLMRTPLDVDSTTRLSGEATLGTEAATPVKATSITRANSADSDDKVIAWVNSSCLVRDIGDPPNCVTSDDPENRLLSASVDNFATDRTSGLAVNDPKYLPPEATEHRGLVNKWPFESKKQTYPYWDGSTGTAENAVYAGEGKIEGVDIYRYKISVADAPVEVTDGVQGTYSSERTISVEPLTGAIVNQEEHRELKTEDGSNFLTLDLAFTPGQVKTSVEDAKDNVSSLNLVTKTVPIIGYILGVILLAAGILLSLRNGTTPTEHRAEKRPALAKT